MIYIVFDLETTMTYKPDQPKFIIEIGAVKLEEKDNVLRIVDTFQTYVRPPKINMISKRTLKLIGAKADSFEKAPRIYDATRSFKRWIGEDEYCLIGWSDSDLWILGEHNKIEKKMVLSWVKNFTDIQPFIAKVLAGKSIIALKKAIEINNPEAASNSKFHSAITDSFATAKLFIDYFEVIKKHIKVGKNPFSVVSSTLFRSCKVCNESKYYTEYKSFRKKNGAPTCKQCYEKNKLEWLQTEKEKEWQNT